MSHSQMESFSVKISFREVRNIIVEGRTKLFAEERPCLCCSALTCKEGREVGEFFYVSVEKKTNFQRLPKQEIHILTPNLILQTPVARSLASILWLV